MNYSTNRSGAITRRASKINKRVLSTMTSLVAMVASSGAYAAEVKDDIALNEIIVTATKTGQTNLQNTPLTITAVSGDDLESRNLSDMKEIGNLIPNANFVNLGGFSQAFIRGVGNTSQGAAIGGETNISFYIDGVYLERGMGANTEFYDVERVEVLRGPQGTLYGRNATGGAVNIITKAPTDDLDVKIGAMIGNYSKKRFDMSVSSPIVEDKISARFSASYNKRDGYIKNLIGNDIYDEDTFGLRGKLYLTPSEKVKVTLAGDYYNQDNFDTIATLIYDARNPSPLLSSPTPSGFWEAKIDGPVNDRAKAYGLSGTLEANISESLTFKSITAYRSWDRNFLWDIDNNRPNRAHIELGDKFNTLTQELQLDGKSDRLSWVIGAFYYSLENDWGGNFYFDAIIPGFVRSPNLHLETESWALFGNIGYEIADNLNFNVGLRYSDETKVATTRTRVTIGGVERANTTVTNKASWDDISPRFAIDYKPTDNVMIYGSISKGFRAGQIADSNPAPFSPRVDPEDLWAYELGVKSKWLDGRLKTNLAGFYYDYKGLQQTTVFDGLSVVTNASNAAIKGFELEAELLLFKGLKLSGNYSYTDSKYENYVDVNPYTGLPIDVSGNMMRYAPKNKGNIALNYEIDTGNGGVLALRGDAVFVGKTHFSTINDSKLSQNPYTLLNAGMSYKKDGSPWSIAVFGKNISKTKYYRNIGVNGLVGNALEGRVGEPSTYGIQLTIQY